MQFFEYIAQKRCYYYSTIFFCRKDKNRKKFCLFSPNFPAILTKKQSFPDYLFLQIKVTRFQESAYPGPES